ncbi:hypothetical protein HETIRDRAFT_173361 [Heterobasidion irregulare TC 32-1]|uniref:PQ-loop-domain-containing protein n=1 Tax=Heterobasidion irregulare (strain TC 32-1) TaxID=747525 RepID=W4K9C5_HETIT|nr:uncharacterized protein HETIRDRAFT_173361 [Heterobasidion irregulare TC 32-1]ETW81686.1 hypothetical protein HETIRDRAFT_173361 [Heterobasidion irregulare TC 32-1]
MLSSDSLSNALGWISIACWIVVYSPQIFENYQLKSGEALSVLFVAVWLLGDLCNLVGASMAGLLPTVILLAIYYSLCDIILLFQIYYYRRRKSVAHARSSDITVNDASETTHLLSQADGELPTVEGVYPPRLQLLKYLGAVIFVFATGIAAWAISEKLHQGKEDPSRPEEILEWRSQVLGWISAVLYLKNLKTRCEGLSPGLFLFAILGNLTYGLSICVSSTKIDHLIANASWLAADANELTGVPACAGAMSVCILSDGGACVQKEQ